MTGALNRLIPRSANNDPRPSFDADGYPTEETLALLAAWSIEKRVEGLQFMADAWHWPEWVGNTLRGEEIKLLDTRSNQRYWRFATGGWSGNESLVNAFMKSPAAFVTWALHARGGLWIFEERTG